MKRMKKRVIKEFIVIAWLATVHMLALVGLEEFIRTWS